MQADKSATILEAQWIEKEIPRIEEELQALKKMEQELLTTPLETVSQAYTNTYRRARKRAFRWYHRRRSVTPTRYGYRERMLDVGWMTVLARLLVTATIVLAAYMAYDYHQMEQTQRGVIWGSALLIAGIGLALAPATIDQLLEWIARRRAQRAADLARQSEAFAQEKQERQTKLKQCQARVADLQERLAFARVRFDELRKELTTANHQGQASP